MKFRNFCGVQNTRQQAYYKAGELLYANQDKAIHVAILPAYNPEKPDPTGWIPAVGQDGVESDFYTVVRAAKFVGHGNRHAQVAFISPKTFDPNADDPYEAFHAYCSRSDKWSYLTTRGKRKRLTGELDGEPFPAMRNFFVANVMDADAGSRGGVFLVELPETVMEAILYRGDDTDGYHYGLAMQRDDKGALLYGDITNPDSALVIEVVKGRSRYTARPSVYADGRVMRTKIPETLLQHRLHMEEPGSFLVRPESGQQIVDRLADLLRGYKSDDGTDEIFALEEAMRAFYGRDRFIIGDEPSNIDLRSEHDPFGGAAAATVKAEPVEKAEAVSAAVDNAMEQERYTPAAGPAKPDHKPKKAKKKAEKKEPAPEPEFVPGEDVDPNDIASIRAMLAGGT